jgi:hypothetical protein
MQVHFERWQKKYGLGGRDLRFDPNELPLLDFLILQSDSPFEGTTTDIITHALSAPRDTPGQFTRYTAMYCVLTEVSELPSTTSREVQVAALDDLRLLFRFGPDDCNLIALLWDIDHRAALPKSFDGADRLTLVKKLPLDGQVRVLERLLDAGGISLPDAKRFLTEFLMEGAAVPDAARALHVRVRVDIGDEYGAWRCIEKCGDEELPGLLDLLERKCTELGRIAELARIPFHTKALAIMEKRDPALAKELRIVRP